MDQAGLEMFARCVERNVADAAWAANTIQADLERRIKELEAELSRERLQRYAAERRIRWLLGGIDEGN